MTVSRRMSPTLDRRTAVRTGAAGLAAGHLAVHGAFAADAHQAGTPTPSHPQGIASDHVAQAVDALDTVISDAMGATGVPGLSVAVVYRDEVLTTRGDGIGNTDTNAPVDADTVFQLASLSKPLASTVVASIVGDDAVTWDSGIIDTFPAFAMHDPWVTSQITIRDMFCHRSELPEHAGDLLEDLGYDRTAVLHRLRSIQPASSFRSAYAYTNFGLTAAAVAAANAAGSTWEDACDERLYHPAGMTRTSSRFGDFINADNRAAGHVLIDGAWVPKYTRNPDPQSPAGGVSSTANDMAQWMRLQLGSGSLDGTQIVDTGALAETHRPWMIRDQPADPAVDFASFYGLAWNINYDDHGGIQLSHSGAFALGAGTAVYLLPGDQLGIVVLTNGSPVGLAESIALGFLDIARTGAMQNDYPTLLAPVFADLMKPAYGTAVDYSTPPTNPSPARDASSYIGVFSNTLFGPVEIAEHSGELTLGQGPGPDVYPLTHRDRDTFLYLPTGENANVESAVTFTIGAGGIASHVTIENLNIHGQGTFTRTAEAA